VAFLKDEVLTVMITMITVFLNMLPYVWWIGTNVLEGICFLNIQGMLLSISPYTTYPSGMKMEAAGSSEILILIYKDYGVTVQKMVVSILSCVYYKCQTLLSSNILPTSCTQNIIITTLRNR
jgi:hypothetical protein